MTMSLAPSPRLDHLLPYGASNGLVKEACRAAVSTRDRIAARIGDRVQGDVTGNFVWESVQIHLRLGVLPKPAM